MIIPEYTQAGACNLNIMKFAAFTRPFPIKLYWFRTVDYNTNRRIITPRVHHHRFFEVHFVLQGEMHYQLDCETLQIHEGFLTLLPPGIPHRAHFYSEDFLKLSLAFEMEASTCLSRALLKHGTCCLPIPDEVLDCISFIFSEAENNSELSVTLIENRIFEMICRLSRNFTVYEGANTQIRTQEDERLLLAKQYIREHICSALTCKDVAAYCHLSVKQMGRIFEKYEGRSLLKYIHAQKIQAAEQLLTAASDCPLKEISSILGFSSEYYFSKFFTAHTGMTPGDYRTSSR